MTMFDRIKDEELKAAIRKFGICGGTTRLSS
jgi:hypothetical protein